MHENIPSKYLKHISGYNGDFPATLSAINASQLQNASIFEIADTQLLAEINNLPLWLDHKVNKEALFQNYLDQNMLKEAWLTLNAKGWKLHDAARALKEIANKTDDALFHLVANNWIQGWNRSGNQEGFY